MNANDEADLDTVLGELEDQWKSTPIPKDDRSPVPDGKYQVRVERAELACDRTGTWRLKWDLVIVAGPCAKRHLFHSNQLNAQGIEWVKRDLARAGVTPPETMRGLRATVDSGELLDRVLEVQTKTTRSAKDGKDYQNSYINGNNGTKMRVPAEPGTASSPSASAPPFDDGPPPESEDLPF